MNAKWIFGTVTILVIVYAIVLFAQSRRHYDVELLNVSYDPTRELWREMNQAFIEDYEQKTGKSVNIRQSHAAGR